jgi:hypothetical protein
LKSAITSKKIGGEFLRQDRRLRRASPKYQNGLHEADEASRAL